MAEAGEFLEQFTDEEKEKLAKLQFAVVVGRFYEDLALRLLDGADHGFQMAGVPIGNVTHHSVPGGPEIGGVACLGVVIRGETDHYDFVCAEAARGIQDVQLATGVPCAFGVITCDNMEQALARSGGDKRDQGRNAALTVARMALLKRRTGYL
jgi:6,7-dimethyl-8-ribityllumazine synthase